LSGRVVDVPRVQLDISLINETLGWSPRTSMEDGLKRTVEWIEDVIIGR
jgi:nucleoside-diphosphate-sugar epimerase